MDPSAEQSASRPLYQVIAETFLFSMIDLTALFGNLFVLLAIGRNADLRKISSICVSALAVTDLLMAVFCMPFSVVTLASGWSPGVAFCHFQGFAIFTFGIASIFTMGLIAVSRYFGIVRPSQFKVIFTRRRTIAFIATAWSVAFVTSSPPHFFKPSGFQFHPGKVMCLYDFKSNIGYSLYLDIFNISGTLTVINICYTNIFRQVSRTNKVFSQQNDVERLRANIKEAKVTKSLLAVVVGFFMCWGPIGVVDVIDMVRRSSTPLPREVGYGNCRGMIFI